jgi:16S rRNA (adenine1518-N6/adenine1519-N6)-dimethyltransferase
MEYDERESQPVTTSGVKNTSGVTGSAGQQAGEPRKSLGQHWLTDEKSLEAMCNAADVATEDNILEVGPGRGSLTASLLDRGASVVAVELDERLGAELTEKFKDKPFILNMLSILDFDFTSLPADYKIVANIPYYLTSHLLRQLSETPNQPSIAVLLVQKEVAERVVAGPGEMSLLSAAVQFYYQPDVGQVVPAKLFTPPPKVDSQILILKRRAQPVFTDVDTKKFFRLVKAGFSQRRKKLRSSLSGGLGISKQQAEDMLQKANIDPNLRPQELSLADWHDLYKNSPSLSTDT